MSHKVNNLSIPSYFTAQDVCFLAAFGQYVTAVKLETSSSTDPSWNVRKSYFLCNHFLFTCRTCAAFHGSVPVLGSSQNISISGLIVGAARSKLGEQLGNENRGSSKLVAVM